jgi:hypothetical protein
MTNEEKIELAKECGLAYGGEQDGEVMFIGTEKEWREFDKLLSEPIATQTKNFYIN